MGGVIEVCKAEPIRCLKAAETLVNYKYQNKYFRVGDKVLLHLINIKTY